MQSYTSLRYILSFLWYTLGSVQAFTYWIDSSCYDKLHYTVIPEAVEFYSSANYRMHLMTDRNQETAFNLLFKVPYLDAASYNEVNRITAGVAGFTLIDERPNSDLRVYCDNDEEGPDKRWRPVPDILDLPEGVVPNSQRTYGVDQEMYDHINGFRAEINRNEKLGCQVEGVFAITYLNLRDKVGENENRTILTVCAPFRLPSFQS